MKKVLILGEDRLSVIDREKVLSMLPFAAERFDPKIRWTQRMRADRSVPVPFVEWIAYEGDLDLNAPSRRDAAAISQRAALVVVDGAKFIHRTVRQFRLFGLRIFWYKAGRIQEVNAPPKALVYAYTQLPGEGTSEPQLWDEQRAAKASKRDDFQPIDWESQIIDWCRFRESVTDKWLAKKAATQILRCQIRMDLDAIPYSVNWNQKLDDAGADESDICEWSKKSSRDEDAEWQRRCREAGC